LISRSELDQIMIPFAIVVVYRRLPRQRLLHNIGYDHDNLSGRGRLVVSYAVSRQSSVSSPRIGQS